MKSNEPFVRSFQERFTSRRLRSRGDNSYQKPMLYFEVRLPRQWLFVGDGFRGQLKLNKVRQMPSEIDPRFLLRLKRRLTLRIFMETMEEYPSSSRQHARALYYYVFTAELHSSRAAEYIANTRATWPQTSTKTTADMQIARMKTLVDILID